MFEKFYERYAPDEQEVIVLIQHTLGARYDNGFWDMTVISLGMVFSATGETNIRKGRLEWPVTKKEINGAKGWKRFEREQIYRIKVRKLLDEYVPKEASPEKFNSWAIIEVLEQSVACPELEAVLVEYKKPVIIEDKVLGTLILNREFDMFETTLLWNRKYGMKTCGNLRQRNSQSLPTTGRLRMREARIPNQLLRTSLRSVSHSWKFLSHQVVALLLIIMMMICLGDMP